MSKDDAAAELLSFVNGSDADVVKATDKLNEFCSKGDAELTAAFSAASEAIATSQKKGDTKAEAKAMNALATVQGADGKYADALESAESALAIFQSLSLTDLVTFMYNSIAAIHLSNNKTRKALYYAQEAFAMSDSKSKEAMGLIVKAYIQRGQPDAAIAEATDGLKEFQDKGDVQGAAESQMLLFLAYQQVGETDVALNALEDAIQAFKELGDSSKECSLLMMSAELQLKEGKHDKAADDALRAMELVKKDQKWTEMAGALKLYVDAKIASGDAKDALNVAVEARETFEKAGASKAEASACLVLSSAHRATGKYDRAATAAKAAQEIAYQEEDEKGEAMAHQIMADVYMADDKYDKALRSADLARRLWKGLGIASQESNALNIAAQAHVNLAHRKESMEGAKGDVWEKALKAGKEALKFSREVAEDDNGALYVATALCSLAEVHLAKKQADDAMEASNEAVALFMEANEEPSGAYAWVLCAQADVLKEDWNQGRDDAMEGLEIFKEIKDERGESYAQSVLDMIEKMAPPPVAMAMDPAMMAQMMAMQGGGGMKAAASGQPMPMMAQAAAAAPDAGGAAAGAVVRKGGTGALSVLNEESVIKKVREVAMGIVGDDEEIEVDTPLMQAGITSNTAVVLRDELAADLPGINLPPTLLFDYPSIQGIADFVVSKAS